jgi:intraflagellar transport protein 88
MKALTNKGNCYFADKEFEKAKHYYEDALKIDASCVEALYNLGKKSRSKIYKYNKLIVI